MTETDIDRAHAAMTDSPDDDVARLKFYEMVADSELFLLLAGDPEGDMVEPEVFNIQDQQFALVFDKEDRLAGFVGRAVPYAEIPGRGLIHMLEGKSVGLALNLETGPSSMLIPSDAVDWLAQTLRHGPEQTEARLVDMYSPGALPELVVDGLAQKLTAASGMASHAFLAAATYEGGMKGHVLAFVDAVEGAEKPLAQAAGEALTFSGIEAGTLDVLFAVTGDPVVERLTAVGLRFDLPQPETPPEPIAPGMDPAKPPKLR